MLGKLAVVETQWFFSWIESSFLLKCMVTESKSVVYRSVRQNFSAHGRPVQWPWLCPCRTLAAATQRLYFYTPARRKRESVAPHPWQDRYLKLANPRRLSACVSSLVGIWRPLLTFPWAVCLEFLCSGSLSLQTFFSVWLSFMFLRLSFINWF